MSKLSSLAIILLLFIGIIFAVNLLNPISTNVQKMTSMNLVVSDLIDISNARIDGGEINSTYPLTVTNPPKGYLQTICPLSDFQYGNNTANWTLNTDYVINLSSGILYVNNTDATNGSTGISGNTTQATYHYCQEGYIPNSAGRDIARLILILATIGLLGIVIYYAYNEIKNAIGG